MLCCVAIRVAIPDKRDEVKIESPSMNRLSQLPTSAKILVKQIRGLIFSEKQGGNSPHTTNEYHEYLQMCGAGLARPDVE